MVCSRSHASPAALMCAMNSSVTCDSATSVTSSLCLLIRLSSRSKGPSKLSRRTANAPARPGRRRRATSSASTARSVIDRSGAAPARCRRRWPRGRRARSRSPRGPAGHGRRPGPGGGAATAGRARCRAARRRSRRRSSSRRAAPGRWTCRARGLGRRLAAGSATACDSRSSAAASSRVVPSLARSARNRSSAAGRLTRRDTGPAPPWPAGGRPRRRRSVEA